MRPSMRFPSLQGSRSLYVCSTCRQEVRPRPQFARQFLRNASSTPITERVRRKIWGTENPPGLKDPYGGEGVIERRFKQNQPEGQESEQPALEQQPEFEGDIAPGDEYVPATTWDGLERIGHLGGWSDYPSTATDSYSPFMSKTKLTKKEHLALAAHQTAVEVCLLHTLKKPLTNVCSVGEHEKAVFKLIWRSQIKPSENGQWDGVLTFPNKEAEKSLLYIFEQIGGQPQAAVAEQATGKTQESVEGSEIEAAMESASNPPREHFFGYQNVRDKGFLALPLNDIAIKFAFLKRFSQLTGHYFPDPAIHSITTVKQAMQYVQKALTPKPKKLAEHLVNNPTLQALPNVKIFAKRQKPSNKDEEYGRKKIIEAELRARNLIE